MPLDRRAFLVGAGAGAGWLIARGLGVPGLRAPAERRSFAATLRELGASLTSLQREHVVLPLDHPSRQINNTFAVLRGPHLGTLLSPAQRALVVELYESMLSPRGVDAFQGTVAVEGRFDGCDLAIYGEPTSGDAHVVISGGHLLVRGGKPAPGAALGGGVAYGHQTGNELWRVPGNSFAYHGDAANRFVASLAPHERAAAILPEPPHELLLQSQRAGASFPGVGVASLGDGSKQEMQRLLDTVFSCYPEAQRREALACIDHHGGIDALHFASYASRGFYEDMQPWSALDEAARARRGDPYWQVWRIEGPGTVVFFKGYPHVHAYIDVVRDPARVHFGESLARVDATLEGEPMRRLLEAALRRATGEPLAYQPPDVPGRFCAGEVTTGLAWSLDPYANHIVVATVEGRATSEELRGRLTTRGVAIEPGARYRVASIDYAAREGLLGEPLAVESSATLVREALVAELRASGLAAATTAA